MPFKQNNLNNRAIGQILCMYSLLLYSPLSRFQQEYKYKINIIRRKNYTSRKLQLCAIMHQGRAIQEHLKLSDVLAVEPLPNTLKQTGDAVVVGDVNAVVPICSKEYYKIYKTKIAQTRTIIDILQNYKQFTIYVFTKIY